MLPSGRGLANMSSSLVFCLSISTCKTDLDMHVHTARVVLRPRAMMCKQTSFNKVEKVLFKCVLNVSDAPYPVCYRAMIGLRKCDNVGNESTNNCESSRSQQLIWLLQWARRDSKCFMCICSFNPQSNQSLRCWRWAVWEGWELTHKMSVSSDSSCYYLLGLHMSRWNAERLSDLFKVTEFGTGYYFCNYLYICLISWDVRVTRIKMQLSNSERKIIS